MLQIVWKGEWVFIVLLKKQIGCLKQINLKRDD